jgi:hypothetical protein
MNTALKKIVGTALKQCLSCHQDYAGARDAFQQCVALCPDFTKAWVSWAQLEKRVRSDSSAALGDHLQRCRTVLQRGLSLNPNNARLCQVGAHQLVWCSIQCGVTMARDAKPYIKPYISCMAAVIGLLI